MKLFGKVAAALVIMLSVGHAFADTDCEDYAHMRTRRYQRDNEAQQAAVQVLQAIHYIECKSTFAEMARDLDKVQIATLDAYTVGTTDGPMHVNTFNSFSEVVRQLGPLQARIEAAARTQESQESAMKLRVALRRVRNMLGR